MMWKGVWENEDVVIHQTDTLTKTFLDLGIEATTIPDLWEINKDQKALQKSFTWINLPRFL